MTKPSFVNELSRFSSGIPGLDRVLDGGFFAGGVYLVEGVPGSGKTILANQICFHHAKNGGRTLYVTLLAESHSRLLQHLQGMTFFEPEAIPERLTYVSGFRVLEDEGLKGMMDLLRKELRSHHASLVILDGFAAVGESADSDRAFKKLVHELQVHAGLARCTFFLLSSGVATTVQPVHTMVDGLVRLTDHVFGVRAERELQVQKFRGSNYLRGVHTFNISDHGIDVYPRIEAMRDTGSDPSTGERLSTGIPKLDAMLSGGLMSETTTMVLGPTGVGKTCLGYSFLAQSNDQQPGLLFTFYETPQRARHKAGGLGLDFDGLIESGALEIQWQPPVESSLDRVGNRILEAVERRGVRRLFIDGFNALEHCAAYPERIPQFFAALAQRLRSRGVTTVYAAEIHDIFSPHITPPALGLSPLLESLIVMRFSEIDAELRRVISVMKLRDSGFDSRLCEFEITHACVKVSDTLPDAEGMLTGVAHAKSKGVKPEAGRAAKGGAKSPKKPHKRARRR
ncbi:MAG TPA: ATPase domain-containing protein [Polyangiaceae bacterium]